MKQLPFIFTIALTFSVAAEDSTTNTLTKASSGKEPSVLQRVGGFVIDYSAAKGKYSFIDCQKHLDTKMIKGLSVKLKDDYAWNFEFITHPTVITSTREAIALKERYGATAATIITDSDALPLMTVAPEANVAVVNVHELAADCAKPILIENRLVRETLRAFVFSLGVGYTTFDVGLTQPIASAADLDRFSSNLVSPDSANSALQNGAKIGFKPYRRTTYKRACKEGWAPAPTNEFQKAVWEKVKADKERGPTNPIEIPMPEKK